MSAMEAGKRVNEGSVMIAKMGLLHAHAAPISMPIGGVGPDGDRMTSNARLSAKASHNVSPVSPPGDRSTPVIVSSPLARHICASSAAKGSSLAECDKKTSYVFLWFAMVVPHALCKFV